MAVLLIDSHKDTGTVDVEPLSHDLNSGESWGLEHPIISGWRLDRGCWMAWDRHTGEVMAVAMLGTYGAERLVSKFSEPDGYNDEYIDFDGIP